MRSELAAAQRAAGKAAKASRPAAKKRAGKK
jgi:hypothetical protein